METWHSGTNWPEERKETCFQHREKSCIPGHVTCWWSVLLSNCPLQRLWGRLPLFCIHCETLKPNATPVLKVMVKVFWAIEEVKSQRRGHREIKQNHSRRFQCPLQSQLHASLYLWLLIEAGQIPPQNLLHSSVGIIFKDGPAEQNIKCSLYWSHITLISYQYDNTNFNCISPQLKGSNFCAAASEKGVSQQKYIYF